jgi:site-specific recombinase XerD
MRNLPSRMKSAYVFPSKTGTSALNANNFINRFWNPARKRASLEGLRWHDLRHTFASRLVMAGVDLRTVQELMGHKTITMTLRYAHLSPTHQREAVQRLTQKSTATTTATGQSAA